MAAYLTVEQYVARFGDYETKLFTAEDPNAPTFDTVKVESALDDATEEVEGYIATRYGTPLASPPPIVKGWVAALARLKLANGSGRVSQPIKDEVDRVTRQLERMVDGKLKLPVDAGAVAPVERDPGAPLTSGDAAVPIFTGSTLAGFTDMFTGAAQLPAWRRGG